MSTYRIGFGQGIVVFAATLSLVLAVGFVLKYVGVL